MTFDRNFTKAFLLTLSNELLQSIFGYLRPIDLTNVDLTCKRFCSITEPIYHIIYGPNTYLHRKIDNPPNWKALVLEEECIKKELPFIESFTPDTAIGKLFLMLLDRYHLENAKIYIAQESKILIVSLRNCTEQGTLLWLEAMATALMAQGRLDDAKHAYQTFLENDQILPEQTLLTAAHFGWPNTFPPLPDNISQGIKEKAIFGAAAGCNQEMVIRLHMEGVSLDQCDGSTTLAKVGAAVGNLPLLKYLYERGVDVLEIGNELLQIAALHCQLEVVNFLLSLGGRFDAVQTGPFETAITRGNIQLLRIFFKHMPGLVSAKSAEGKPVMFTLLTSIPTSRNRTETLEYLVQEACMDIYAADDIGNTLAHLAASCGDLEFTKLLRKFNMDLTTENIVGHTPQDLASTAGHTELAIWLAGNNGTAYQPEVARGNAAKIITSRHSTLIQRLASDPTCAFPGDTVEERAASFKAAWDANHMDDKLVTVYLGFFSPGTLQQWNEILGGEVDHLMLKLDKISQGAFKTGADLVTLTDEEESRQEIARSIVDKLVDIPWIKPIVQRAIVRNMASADLQTLSDFFNGELGRKIAAGVIASANDVMIIWGGFLSACRISAP
jgi:hypothetical protein